MRCRPINRALIFFWPVVIPLSCILGSLNVAALVASGLVTVVVADDDHDRATPRSPTLVGVVERKINKQYD